MRGKGALTVFIVAVLSLAAPCMAGEGAAGDIETRLKAVEETVARQQEVIDQQARRIAELESATPGEQAVEKLAARAAAPAAAPETPSWLRGLRFFGDLRLRYEGAFLEDSDDENMGRMRLRFGVEKQVTDEVLAGFRLATGSSSDPTSTNQTFTNNFGKKDVWIDLAYAIYAPEAVKGLTIGAGKVKNPFITTDMMWDSDVNPEGAFQNYTWQAADCWKPFVTLGEFMVESNGSGHDANLLAAQAGWDLTVCPSLVWTVAAGYYDFFNIEEPGNFYAANGNTENGGALTAGDFDAVDLVSTFNFTKLCVPLQVFGHVAENIGDSAPRPDNDLSSAWAVGVIVGCEEEKGDWQFDYAYKHIEANAFPGAFVDHDFGPGRRGHALGLSYVFHKNVIGRIESLIIEPERGHGEDLTTVTADLVFRL